MYTGSTFYKAIVVPGCARHHYWLMRPLVFYYPFYCRPAFGMIGFRLLSTNLDSQSTTDPLVSSSIWNRLAAAALVNNNIKKKIACRERLSCPSGSHLLLVQGRAGYGEYDARCCVRVRSCKSRLFRRRWRPQKRYNNQNNNVSFRSTRLDAVYI